MADTENAPKPDGAPAPATPTTPTTPAPAPAAPGKPGEAGKKGKTQDEVAPGADVLKDNLNTIALVLLIAAALAVVIVFQVRKDRGFNDQAWSALAEQRAKTGTDGFDELITKYRGSEAEAYIRVTYAARLYDAGTRETVEKAREQLEAVLAKHRDNAFLHQRVTDQLARIKAELEDPRAQLAAKPPEPEQPDEGDEHGPDDGHGH